MKSEKGITLISLTVYIIVALIMIVVIAVISTYFYTNTDTSSKMVNPLTEYTKFNGFLAEEINHSNLKILKCEEDYIVFDNGIQYSYIPENKGIYRNYVKICRDVERCIFQNKIKNGKNVISVYMKIGTSEGKNVDYTIENY
mgnify:CR=1 FL=1